MYEIFYISKSSNGEFNKLKNRFPLAKCVASLEEAKRKSFTKFFWAVWPDLIINDNFKFDYKVTEWDKDYTHVFKNGEFYDGVCLFPKNKTISQKENDYRFFVNRKEIDIQASISAEHKVFTLSTYDDYLKAAEVTTSNMFWAVLPGLEVDPSFKFDYQVPAHDQHITHVFKNGKFYDGVCLFPKNKLVTQKEFDHRFFVNKKEIDIQASQPIAYNRFTIKTYDDYVAAANDSSTNMFWAVWYDVVPSSNFTFDYQVPTHDQNITHIFLNGEFYDGICLFSKNKLVTKKEFEHRFFINKKEIEIQASTPLTYSSFVIDSYDDYLKARESTVTDMFWCIPKEVAPNADFKFDLYFSHHNSYDRAMHHVFKHQFNSAETFNGIMLLSKKLELTKKEIDFRFLIKKKEYDIVASTHRHYDIVFISYNEPNADENFKILQSKFSNVKRVHGVKGIHQAHIEAAKLTDSHMFWVVDGDAIIEDTFNFDYLVTRYERDIVHVWKSRNPINGLVYGYGGVKLLPKDLTLNMDVTTPDMTTAISNHFKPMSSVSNITSFNTDPFNTWKSAFRECVKLSSSVIARQDAEETLERLKVWCTLVDNVPYGSYAYLGALAGQKYGQENAGNIPALRMINDFDWLKDQFETSSEAIGNTVAITSAQALATS
jgi:hypothetical protein